MLYDCSHEKRRSMVHLNVLNQLKHIFNILINGKVPGIFYVFLSPELAKYCISADIWYDDITDSLSDHYPMVVDFHF